MIFAAVCTGDPFLARERRGCRESAAAPIRAGRTNDRPFVCLIRPRARTRQRGICFGDLDRIFLDVLKIFLDGNSRSEYFCLDTTKSEVRP